MTRENGIGDQEKTLRSAGHTLRKPKTNTIKQALRWNPGHRGSGGEREANGGGDEGNRFQLATVGETVTR